MRTDEATEQPSPWSSSRWQWVELLVALAGLAVLVGLTVLLVRPVETGGLYAVVEAAVGFPIIAVWAGRLSSEQMVEAVRRSAQERNALLGLGLEDIRKDFRSALGDQTNAVTRSIGTVGEQMASLVKEAIESVGRVEVAVRGLSQEVAKSREDSARAQEAAIELADRTRRSFEEMAKIEVTREERAKPSLFVQTQVRPAWIFFRHNWLLIGNVGGIARTVVVNYRFHQGMSWIRLDPPFDLAPQRTWEYDLGDIRQASGSGRLNLSIEARDDFNRIHETGDIFVDLNGNRWIPVTLKTRA